MKNQPSATGQSRKDLNNAIQIWLNQPEEAGKLQIGSHATVKSLPDGTFLCTSHSLTMEGIHADLTYQSLLHIGYKSAVTALLPLLIRGCSNLSLSVQLALPRKITSALLKDFYEGFRKGALECNSYVAGTDIVPSSSNLVVSVSGTGVADAQNFISGNQFKPGDLLAVTGYPGRSYAGLRILLREKEFFQSQQENYKPNLTKYSWVVERYLAPRPATDTLLTLQTAGIRPRSASLLKNGLANDIHELIQSSHVGMEIEENLLPSHERVRAVAEEFGDDDLQYMLYGGDDYQFLLFFDPKDQDAIESIDDITIIGSVNEETGQLMLVTPGEGRKPIDPFGNV